MAARTASARGMIETHLTAVGFDLVSAEDIRTVLSAMLDALDKAENPLVSVKEFGAVGNGVADDTVAIQAALNEGAWKTIFFPVGSYKITSTLTVPNAQNIRLLGGGRHNTIIHMFGNGNILTMTNPNHCALEELVFLRGSGTGNGVVFSGQNGSNGIDHCAFEGNTGYGLAFTASQAVPQSSNRVTRCRFLSNTLEQLYMFWSNDSTIAFNTYGGGTGPYATAACFLNNSSAGQYISNEHWNNTIALKLTSSNFLRIANNRFEESRQEGVLATTCLYCQFNGNYLHTNSQSSSGTYSALRLSGSTSWNITGNTFMSWNALRHKHSIEVDGTSGTINMVGNMMAHNTGANINTSTATNVNSTGNM